jgi:hypothetical protein
MAIAAGVSVWLVGTAGFATWQGETRRAFRFAVAAAGVGVVLAVVDVLVGYWVAAGLEAGIAVGGGWLAWRNRAGRQPAAVSGETKVSAE